MVRVHFSVSLLMLFIGLWLGLTNAKFYEEQKPCKYEDSECIIKLIDFYLSRDEEDSSLNLVQIDPLLVAKARLKQGAEKAVSIDLTFTNLKLMGLSGGRAYKVSGFGKDLTKKHEVFLNLKINTLIADYKIDGKVLILPIKGTGTCNITMVDTNLGMHFSGTPYEKDDGTYMKVNNMKLTWDPKRLYYNFDNLFDGDKVLGENVNLFLNENWKDIFDEVHDSMSKVFGKIFAGVINKVFSKYPYEKFFVEE